MLDSAAGGPTCAQVIRYPGFPADAQSGALPQAFLPMRYHAQHTDVWCWAASSASVVEYLRGGSVEDCEVLSRYAQLNGRPIDCCGAPYMCLRGALSMGEIQTVLLEVGNVRAQWLRQPLSECALRQELANGRPVIAWVTSIPGVAAHVIVISGYDSAGLFHVQDPYFGDFQGVAYAAILSNATLGAWTDTLFLINAGPVPPRPPVDPITPHYGCTTAPPSLTGAVLVLLAMMRPRRRRQPTRSNFRASQSSALRVKRF